MFPGYHYKSVMQKWLIFFGNYSLWEAFAEKHPILKQQQDSQRLTHLLAVNIGRQLYLFPRPKCRFGTKTMLAVEKLTSKLTLVEVVKVAEDTNWGRWIAWRGLTSGLAGLLLTKIRKGRQRGLRRGMRNDILVDQRPTIRRTTTLGLFFIDFRRQQGATDM